MKSIQTLRPLLAIVLFAGILFSCDDDPNRVDYSSVPEPFNIEEADSSVTLESGLQIYIIEEGVGEFKTNIRDRVNFFYTKRLKKDKDEIVAGFNGSSYINNVEVPATASLNTVSLGSAIDMQGMQEGLIGMKRWEKRVLIIPPDIAYANTGLARSYGSDTIWVDLELDSIEL